MKSMFTALVLLGAIPTSPAFAATEQQNKMATCNKDAAGMKGDERKAFMKDCLSKKPEAAAPSAGRPGCCTRPWEYGLREAGT